MGIAEMIDSVCAVEDLFNENDVYPCSLHPRTSCVAENRHPQDMCLACRVFHYARQCRVALAELRRHRERLNRP